MAPFRPLVLKIAGFAGLLFVVYYVGWLKPRQELPRTLISAEQQLADRYFHLLESRLALTALTKLDPASAGFNSQRQLIFSSLENLTTEGRSITSEPIELAPLAGAPHSSLRFYNETLPPAAASLQERHQTIVQEYERLVADLLAVENGIDKLLQYRPRRDLETLDIVANHDRLFTRAEAAHQGIDAINANLPVLPLPPSEQEALAQAIASTQTALAEFIDYLKAEDPASAVRARDEFTRRYSLLRVQALASELSLIRTDEAISLLTAQTNLLYEYNFWRHHTRQAFLNLD